MTVMNPTTMSRNPPAGVVARAMKGETMRETDYCHFLFDRVMPLTKPDLASAVLAGLLNQLPASHASALEGEKLWNWIPGRRSGSLAPDRLLGDAQDRLRVVFEMKSRGAAVQWSRRASVRACTPDGAAASAVRDYYFDTALSAAATEEVWDAPHEDDLGCGCSHWKMQPGTALHYPAVHQGDAYTYTKDYIPTGLEVSDAIDPLFVFVDPGNKRAEFEHGLVSKDSWHIVSLPRALEAWAAQSDDVEGLREVVTTTEQFLGSGIRR